MTDNVLNSRKLTNNFNASVKPLIENGGKYDGKVKAIIRQQVQPWHGASTFVHEAALAVSPSLPLTSISKDCSGCISCIVLAERDNI